MILCYHGVRASFEPGISSIPASRLSCQLDYLLASGFRAADPYAAGASGPDLAVTLDDAYSSQVESWGELLASRGFRATLFVPAAFVGAPVGWDYTGRRRQHASWSQLSDWCRQGHAIGSHGMRHCDLRSQSDLDLSMETSGSRKLLEDRLGVEVKHFSYPFGRFDERVVDRVREAGYAQAFTAWPHGVADLPWTRPRVVVSMLDTPLSIEARAQASMWGRVERGKQRIITFWSGGTALRQAWFQTMEKAAA